MRLNCLVAVASVSAVHAWTELHHDPFMNKNIDPIVVPGTYSSHMHTFFGSDAVTNAMPTSADLQKGCYSGENPNDLSAYWTPTLYYVKGGEFIEIPIFRLSTYYTNAFSEIAIPQNFAMIAGNASAQTQAEADHPYNNLEWFCEGTDERESEISKFPTSTCSKNLQVSLRFPNCVNPDNLLQYDFSDNSEKCPEGMKRFPQLRYAVKYQTSKVVPEGWSGIAPFQLSCGKEIGNGHCFHGDFINGWFEDAAETMLVSGGSGYNDGQFIGGALGIAPVAATCTPSDQDPENGTDDFLKSQETLANGSGAVDSSPQSETEAVSSENISTSASASTPSQATNITPSSLVDITATSTRLSAPIPRATGTRIRSEPCTTILSSRASKRRVGHKWRRHH
ncbi:uncharacterized protein CTRU02_215388 [Colletotrichum truncatum]|uniref:Uncharacterized protein n=1 Tax=Colletotrichum truncatum TaxID=5467 RepID=A0ACC3YD32_COLTU|nr:uncharacterized protein CTRU02_13343 [Colletotrichum truncatum]KAF6783580.1 hypothetical protein CTRU02_13343 [Colletotrichum truncatum]